MSDRIRKAALVAEMEDGTRHIYEISDPVHLQIRQHHQIDTYTSTIRSGPSTITVSGAFVGGTIWQGPMPSERQGPPAQIESSPTLSTQSHPLEGSTS